MGRRDFFEERKLKRLVYIFATTLALSIIAFVVIFVMYNNKLKEEAYLGLKQINDIVPNDNLKEASSTSDKNISEIKETNSKNTIKQEKKNTVSKMPVSSKVTNKVNNTSSANTVDSASKNQSDNSIKNEIVNNVDNNKVEENMSFCAPVSGEIIKDFANDTLIYSNTLEEWTTHLGIDIKANKTSIVVASEKGTVESIKTDPRYGLTITIAHENDFKTIYSNLLTTEFVLEGETVEKGQTIATVGESASFEIADEPAGAHVMFPGIVFNADIFVIMF